MDTPRQGHQGFGNDHTTPPPDMPMKSLGDNLDVNTGHLLDVG